MVASALLNWTDLRAEISQMERYDHQHQHNINTIITAHTAITIATIAMSIITTTIITIATMTIDDVAFTESCCPRSRCR